MLHCRFAATRRALAPLRVMVVSGSSLLARQKQHVANHLHTQHHLRCTALMMVHPNCPGCGERKPGAGEAMVHVIGRQQAETGMPRRGVVAGREDMTMTLGPPALGRTTGASAAVAG